MPQQIKEVPRKSDEPLWKKYVNMLDIEHHDGVVVPAFDHVVSTYQCFYPIRDVCQISGNFWQNITENGMRNEGGLLTRLSIKDGIADNRLIRAFLFFALHEERCDNIAGQMMIDRGLAMNVKQVEDLLVWYLRNGNIDLLIPPGDAITFFLVDNGERNERYSPVSFVRISMVADNPLKFEIDSEPLQGISEMITGWGDVLYCIRPHIEFPDLPMM